jgi:hypothetical protein
VRTYNPSTQEAEAGGLRVQGQAEIHSENLSSKKKKNTLKCDDNDSNNSRGT